MNPHLRVLCFAGLVGASGVARAEPSSNPAAPGSADGSEASPKAQKLTEREVEDRRKDSQTQPNGKDANKRADANDTWAEWFTDLVDREDHEDETGKKPEASKRPEANERKASRSQNSLNRFMTRYDSNSDGTVSRDELPAGMRQGFDQIDRDNNGKLTAKELRQHVHRQHQLQRPVVVTYIWLLDAHDGQAGLEELQEAYSTLKQIDHDADGQITQAELKERRKEIAAKMIEKCFENHDDNNDGQLTRDEARGTVIASRFRRYDENNDGKVGKQEVTAAVDQMFNKAGTSDVHESKTGT